MSKKTGFREKNGKIEYRFRVNNARYSVIGTTERECKAKAQKLITDLSNGLKQHANAITFEEYVNEWLASVRPRVKASTYYSYTKKMKMLSELYPLKMQKIDRRDVIKLQAKLALTHSTSTVNWLITMLRHVFESAVADDVIVKNPAIKIKALKRIEPKATSTIHRALTKDEQDRFFKEIQKERTWYQELYEFMIVTGVRVGEAAALTWKDIDTSIRIDKTVANVGSSQYAIQSTKTEAGCRNLPLTNTARNILARQKLRVAEHKGIAFTAPDQRVFYPFTGTGYVTPNIISHALDYACKKAKIPKFSSHAFRDTYATRCIQQGMQPNTLKKLMGHTKISMTMDLYAQVMPEDMETAMAKISIL